MRIFILFRATARKDKLSMCENYNQIAELQNISIEALMFQFNGIRDDVRAQKVLKNMENQKVLLNSIRRTKRDIEDFISELSRYEKDINAELLQRIYNENFICLEQFPSINTLILFYEYYNGNLNNEYIKSVIEHEYAVSLDIAEKHYPLLYKEYESILCTELYKIRCANNVEELCIDNSQLTRDIFFSIEKYCNSHVVADVFCSNFKVRKFVLSITGKLSLKEKVLRTKSELLLDFYVYNAIATLYYNNKNPYITLKQIKNTLYGDDSRISQKQEAIIKSSIDFLNNVELELSFQNINKYIDTIFRTRKENVQNFLYDDLDYGYVFEGTLLDVSYITYQANNGLPGVAIKVNSPIIPYAFAQALKQIINVPHNILREVNDDYERIDDLIMLSSIYSCSFVKTRNLGRYVKKNQRAMRLNTLLEKLDLIDTSNQQIRNIRCKLYKHIRYAFIKMKERKIVKSFIYDKPNQKIYFEV